LGARGEGVCYMIYLNSSRAGNEMASVIGNVKKNSRACKWRYVCGAWTLLACSANQMAIHCGYNSAINITYNKMAMLY
jgi:hypothetical protein